MRPTAYRRNARGLRDRQAFERIRLQAGELFAAGRSQAEVGHQLGVSRQNVSRWHARWRSGGRSAAQEGRDLDRRINRNLAQHLSSDHDPERDLEHD
jgi:transposase